MLVSCTFLLTNRKMYLSSAVSDINLLREPTAGVLRVSAVHVVVGFLSIISVGFPLFCYCCC
jgi:hypothetical protein